MSKIAFVISHRYYRSYPAYTQHYIENINKFYENSIIVVVDNNSPYLSDVKHLYEQYSNVTVLVNETECKFEVGAYKVGIQYLMTRPDYNSLDYVVFTQDTMVLKNRYDFNILKEGNHTACPIGGYCQDGFPAHMLERVLKPIGLWNRMNEINFCWCCSFVLHQSKVEQFFNYVKDVRMTVRYESEASERWLARIMYELNDHKHYAIEGDIRNITYDVFSVDMLQPVQGHYFVKRAQQKTERTLD